MGSHRSVWLSGEAKANAEAKAVSIAKGQVEAVAAAIAEAATAEGCKADVETFSGIAAVAPGAPAPAMA